MLGDHPTRNFPEVSDDELKLREMLWLKHGCAVGILYGDDGEMQCSHCMIDFRRDTVQQLQDRFNYLGMEQLIKAGIAKPVETEKPRE